MKIFTRKIIILGKVARSYFGYKIGRPKFFQTQIMLNLRCNLSCIYCPASLGSNIKGEAYDYPRNIKYEMTTEQVKKIIDDLAGLGAPIITLTGGEPFLRNDLEEIANYAKNKNMLVTVNTNATLIDESRARLAGECFDSISVPFGGKPETTDKIMGKSFEKKVGGLKFLKKYTKTNINVNFVINRLNFRDIGWMADFAKENADSIMFLPVFFNPDLLLDEDSARIVGQELAALKKKYGNFIINSGRQLDLFSGYLCGKKEDIKCDAMDLYFSIGPDGDVFSCPCWTNKIGNVFSLDIKEIVREGKLRKEDIKKSCPKCATGSVLISGFFREPFFSNVVLMGNLLKRVKLA